MKRIVAELFEHPLRKPASYLHAVFFWVTLSAFSLVLIVRMLV